MPTWSPALATLAVALGVVTTVAAPSAGAAPSPPGPVTHARVDGVSTSAAHLVWHPAGRAAKTVVRVARGSSAPASPVRGGRAYVRGRTVTSLVVHDLTPGTDYSFALFASDGRGHFSRRTVLHASTIPLRVTALRSQVTSAAVSLSWHAPAGGARRTVVRVARSSTPPATPRRGAGVPARQIRSTTARVTGLAPATRYAISVFRLNRRGGYYRPASVRIVTPPRPGPVAYPVAAPTGPTAVRVSWTPRVPAADGGVLIRRSRGTTPPAGPTAGTRVAAVRPTTTAVLDRLTRPGTYAYSLFAYDLAGRYARRATTVVRTDTRSVAAPALQGRVLGSPSATVRASGDDGSVVTATPDADGYYTLSRVRSGHSYDLCAVGGPTGADRTCLDDPVTAGREQAGRVDDIVVPATGRLAVTVSAAGGEVGGASVTLYRAGSVLAGPVLTAPVSDAGPVVRTVAAGTYVVCVDGRGAGLLSGCGHQPWRPGDDPPRDAVTTTIGSGLVTVTETLTAGGSIAGTVTSGPSARAGVTVTARDPDDGTVHARAVTDVHGGYRLTGLTPSRAGEVVCFDATGTGLQSACHPDEPWNPQVPAPSAAAVSVVAGDRIDVDADLVRGASISGTVTGRGRPFGAVTITVFDGDDRVVATTTTTSDGAYAVGGLTASTDGYIVCAEPAGATPAVARGYLRGCDGGAVWYVTARPAGDATPVLLRTGEQRTGVDVRLGPGSAFTGTVRAAVTGRRLPNIRVVVIDQYTETIRAQSTTSSTGTFTVGGLEPRTYRVCFDARHSRLAALGYLDTCWQGGSWSGDVLDVPGTVPAIDVTTTPRMAVSVPLAGAVAGKVVGGADGRPVVGASVQLYARSGARVARPARTAGDGTYLVPDLGAGSYVVCVDPDTARPAATSTGYLARCHPDAAWNPGDDPPVSRSTAVPVTAGHRSPVVHTALGPGGQLLGSVTDGAGARVGGVAVTVSRGDVVARLTTDTAGGYRTDGLPTGRYTVCFDPDGAVTTSTPTGFLQYCAKSAVTAGVRDRLDVRLAPGAAVTGTVSAVEDDAPLGGVEVYAYDTDGDEVGTATTAGDGRYVIAGLTGGTDVRVCFYPGSSAGEGIPRAPQCWRNTDWDGGFTVPGRATPVSLTASESSDGIDARLEAQPQAAVVGAR